MQCKAFFLARNNLCKRKELLTILREIIILRNRAVDESLSRDYTIYINDIRRFLKKVSSLEEIQVYIDDYQAVLRYEKIIDSIKLNQQYRLV